VSTGSGLALTVPSRGVLMIAAAMANAMFELVEIWISFNIVWPFFKMHIIFFAGECMCESTFVGDSCNEPHHETQVTREFICPKQ
jgi:hypothetical protein